jgi:hypothetical protein
MPPITTARDHQHVAVLGEIMRLELGHAVLVLAGGHERIGAARDVAHRERRPANELAG